MNFTSDMLVSFKNMGNLIKLNGKQVRFDMNKIEKYLLQFKKKDYSHIELFRKELLILVEDLEDIKKFVAQMEYNRINSFGELLQLIKQYHFVNLFDGKSKKFIKSIFKEINKDLSYEIKYEKLERKGHLKGNLLQRIHSKSHLEKKNIKEGIELRSLINKETNIHDKLTHALAKIYHDKQMTTDEYIFVNKLFREYFVDLRAEFEDLFDIDSNSSIEGSRLYNDISSLDSIAALKPTINKFKKIFAQDVSFNLKMKRFMRRNVKQKLLVGLAALGLSSGFFGNNHTTTIDSFSTSVMAELGYERLSNGDFYDQEMDTIISKSNYAFLVMDKNRAENTSDRLYKKIDSLQGEKYFLKNNMEWLKNHLDFNHVNYIIGGPRPSEFNSELDHFMGWMKDSKFSSIDEMKDYLDVVHNRLNIRYAHRFHKKDLDLMLSKKNASKEHAVLVFPSVDGNSYSFASFSSKEARDIHSKMIQNYDVSIVEATSDRDAFFRATNFGKKKEISFLMFAGHGNGTNNTVHFSDNLGIEITNLKKYNEIEQKIDTLYSKRREVVFDESKELEYEKAIAALEVEQERYYHESKDAGFLNPADSLKIAESGLKKVLKGNAIVWSHSCEAGKDGKVKGGIVSVLHSALNRTVFGSKTSYEYSDITLQFNDNHKLEKIIIKNDKNTLMIPRKSSRLKHK